MFYLPPRCYEGLGILSKYHSRPDRLQEHPELDLLTMPVALKSFAEVTMPTSAIYVGNNSQIW